MAQETSAAETLELTESSLRASCVHFPETVFMLGGRLEYLPDRIREVNERMHLSMGNILYATPPVYVHLPEFHFARKMVTNGEYLQFLNYSVEDEGQRIRVFNRSDLWGQVWEGMNFQISGAKMPYERRMGEIEEFEENYSGCGSFVEAYIASIRYEIERFLLGLADEGEQSGDVLARLFAVIKFKLSYAMLAEDQDLSDLLTDPERKALEEYTDAQAVLDDIDHVVADLRRVYQRRMDQRFRQAFERGNHPIETLTFLDRIRGEVKAHADDLQASIPLSKVLFPRFWTSERGARRAGIMGRLGKGIPWGELPVEGITLHEALAYCVWVGWLTETNVTLPNEAEFERASSWPRGEKIQGDRCVIDPCVKAVYPWQEHNQKEFHFYFGQEGVDNQTAARQKNVYLKLLEDTSRLVQGPDGKEERIYELEGFGWHWTMDRYSESERKYLRFDSAVWPRYTGVPCFSPEDEALTVYDYHPNQNQSECYFVLKGSPEIVGGPGMTTRRYAAYPFRGYKNVSFRWIIKDE